MSSARLYPFIFCGSTLVLLAACQGTGASDATPSETAETTAEASPKIAEASASSASTKQAQSRTPQATAGPIEHHTSTLTPAEVARLCSTVCETTAQLPCVEAESCTATCSTQYGLPVCRSQLGAMLTCSAEAQLEQFECGQGGPALKDGVCEQEQEAAAACIQAMMQRSAQP